MIVIILPVLLVAVFIGLYFLREHLWQKANKDVEPSKPKSAISYQISGNVNTLQAKIKWLKVKKNGIEKNKLILMNQSVNELETATSLRELIIKNKSGDNKVVTQICRKEENNLGGWTDTGIKEITTVYPIIERLIVHDGNAYYLKNVEIVSDSKNIRRYKFLVTIIERYDNTIKSINNIISKTSKMIVSLQNDIKYVEAMDSITDGDFSVDDYNIDDIVAEITAIEKQLEFQETLDEI